MLLKNFRDFYVDIKYFHLEADGLEMFAHKDIARFTIIEIYWTCLDIYCQDMHLSGSKNQRR